MAQQYASFDTSADAALLASHGGGNTEIFLCQLAVVVTWATAGPSAIAADTQATDPLGATAAINTLTGTWLLLTVTSGGLYLVKEQALTTLTAALAGAGITDDYAIWGRIVAGRVESYQQS